MFKSWQQSKLARSLDCMYPMLVRSELHEKMHPTLGTLG